MHILFNRLNRFSFPFDESKLPKNGIYVLFEKGEHGHGTDRVVRIGTHTGKDQLRSRLNQKLPISIDITVAANIAYQLRTTYGIMRTHR